METLDKTEFYGGELVEALVEAGFKNTYVIQTGGGTATIYASRQEDGEKPNEIDEVILGGPGAYNWQEPRKSVFSTDEFYIGEDQFYSDEETEKSWDAHSTMVTAGASIADMVAIFIKVADEVNEKVRKNPNPNV
ncbi:MAG: hypothetical protein H9W81_13610 [Enterococcus sp.]|nr:hypothetical protein [Enterococcus sp.]